MLEFQIVQFLLATDLALHSIYIAVTRRDFKVELFVIFRERHWRFRPVDILFTILS